MNIFLNSRNKTKILILLKDVRDYCFYKDNGRWHIRQKDADKPPVLPAVLEDYYNTDWRKGI